MIISFRKYHGLGNDFILIDDADESLSASLTPAVIRSLCHRNEGVGGDGILLRQPSTLANHRMLLYNADGSSAEISGNGLRCFVLFLRDCGYLVDKGLTIETGGGIMSARLFYPETIETTMPCPNFTKRDVPDMIEVSLGDETFSILPVNVGNPHGVIFGPPRDIEFARIYGPQLEKHRIFPQGANIEFVHVETTTSCQLVVWERGAGITLACGSGSVATSCAGVALGHFNFDQPIHIHQPGGTLEITIGLEFCSVHQRGPAKFVFDGSVDI